MADSKVSDLTAASALDGTELYYGVQGGADRKVTGAQIRTLASGVTVDTTTITGGTTARLLYDNAGTVGETSKITVVSSGLQINNATSVNDILKIGQVSNAGAISYETNIVGETYVLLGDNTGGSGDAQLKFGNAGALSWQSTRRSDAGSTDTWLGRNAAATLQQGAADAASPVAQTTTVQSVIAGTANTAGADWTFSGSKGTGTGVGGSILFKTAPAGGAGSSQNALATALTIDSTKLATFAAGLTTNGTLSTSGNQISFNGALNANTGYYAWAGRMAMYSPVDGTVRLTQSDDTTNVFLSVPAVATLQHGAADAAAPVAQTLTVQSVIAGTSNTAGADWTIAGSKGTGTGAGGSLVFKTAAAGGAGSSQNALATTLTLNSDGQTVLTAGTQALPALVLGSTAAATGFYRDANYPNHWSYTAGTTSFCFAQGEINFVGNGLLSWGSSVNSFSGSVVDTVIKRAAAATIQFGYADAASPVAQTTTVQSTVAGTSNTAGADWTISGSKGTGTGAGGSLVFKTAPAGGAGSSQNALATALTINSGAQVLVENPGSVALPGLAFASSANTGFIYGSLDLTVVSNGQQLVNLGRGGAGGVAVRSTDGYGWSNSSSNPSGTGDLFLTRGAAATLQIGEADAAAPVAQTTTVQSVVAGTTDTAGTAWTFQASKGTGTGAGGNIVDKTAFSAKSTGSGQGTAVDRKIIVAKGKVLTDATPVSLFEIALPTLTMCGGQIEATVVCTNGTDMQSFTQTISYSAVNKGGVYTKSITASTGDKSVTGGSTLANTWTLLDGTNKVTVQLSSDTSLTPSSNAFLCYYSVKNNSEQATTIL